MADYHKLPKNVIFCKNCVISNQRPSSSVEFENKISSRKKTISIDEDMLCDACKYSEQKKKINWEARENQLLALLDKYRSNGSKYDVVVPGSGGKDSAFTSHILKNKYGMNPLTVTWAPHLYTDIGRQNFDNWNKLGGCDNILFTPNGLLHRKLTQQAFLNLLHPFQPFIIGQRIIGPLVALKFDIPIVFYGENQAEYGNDISENDTPIMQKAFFSSDNAKELVLGGKKMTDYIDQYGFSERDFSPYIPPTMNDLNNAKINVHYLGYYLPWDPQECFYYSSEHTGFQANTERTEGSYSKYSSIDDKIDPFHYYTTLIKFGLGRASYDAAQEIRNRKITRDEGVALVKKFDAEFPKKYFTNFLDYVEIDEATFFSTIEKFRPKHLWKKNNNDWVLRHPIWHNE